MFICKLAKLRFEFEIFGCRTRHEESILSSFDNFMIHTIDLIDELFHELEDISAVGFPLVVEAFIEQMHQIILLYAVENLGLLLRFIRHIPVAFSMSNRKLQSHSVLKVVLL